MSEVQDKEAECIRLKSEIETLTIKVDSLREILELTNKRINFFRDNSLFSPSGNAALWCIAVALWVCVIKLLVS